MLTADWPHKVGDNQHVDRLGLFRQLLRRVVLVQTGQVEYRSSVPFNISFGFWSRFIPRILRLTDSPDDYAMISTILHQLLSDPDYCPHDGILKAGLEVALKQRDARLALDLLKRAVDTRSPVDTKSAFGMNDDSISDFGFSSTSTGFDAKDGFDTDDMFDDGGSFNAYGILNQGNSSNPEDIFNTEGSSNRWGQSSSTTPGAPPVQPWAFREAIKCCIAGKNKGALADTVTILMKQTGEAYADRVMHKLLTSAIMGCAGFGGGEESKRMALSMVERGLEPT